MAANIVEHGILLSESSPLQSYSYTENADATFEQVAVPAINGIYATTGGQRVYLSKDTAPLELSSASITDVEGTVWSIYTEYNEEGTRCTLYKDNGSSRSTITSGTSPILFGLYYVPGSYDPESNTFTASVRISYGTGSSQFNTIGNCLLDRQFVPQAKRNFEIEEEVS